MAGGGLGEIWQPKPGSRSGERGEAWKVTVLGAWRWRLELLLGLAVLGPYVYASHRWEAPGTIAWFTLLGLILAFPQAHQPVGRALRAAQTRRKLARAIIESGGAPRPTVRSRKAFNLFSPYVGKVELTRAGKNVRIKIGRGASLRAIEDAAEEIAVCLHIREVRVIPDRDDRSRATVLLIERDPFDQTEKVPWPLINARSIDLWEPLPMSADENGDPAHVTLLQQGVGAASMLIAGVPGSGKSVLLALYCAAGALSDLDMWLADGKQGLELRDWKDSAKRFVVSMEDCLAMLGELQGVMEDNLARLGEHDLKCVGPETAALGIRPQLLVMDELAVYVLGETKQEQTLAKGITEKLRDLVARGRAAGIIVILCTQRPDAKTIDTRIRDNVLYAHGLRMTRISAEMILPGQAQEGYDCSTISTGQRGVGFLLTEGERPLRVRGCYMSGPDVQGVAVRAARRRLDAMLARADAKASGEGEQPGPDDPFGG